MEFLLGKLAGLGTEFYAYGAFGVALLYILKRIPNANIKAFIRTTFYGLGVVTTLGLAKYKLTKKIWNKYVEPYFVDLINNTVVEGARAYIEGLRSDNK